VVDRSHGGSKSTPSSVTAIRQPNLAGAVQRAHLDHGAHTYVFGRDGDTWRLGRLAAAQLIRPCGRF